MKKFFAVMVALCCFAWAQAQTPVAMLIHNSNATPYYGSNALIDAYNDAQNGDIINLSPGVFNNVEVRKSLTIRGAGMMTDTTAGTLPTIISGSKKIHNPDTGLTMTFEGLYFEDELYMDGIYHAYFNKCYINRFTSPFYGGGDIHGGTFTHCIIREIRGNWLTNCHFYNSVVRDIMSGNGIDFGGSDGTSVFDHCVIQLRRCEGIDKIHSTNSILLLENPDDTISIAATCDNHHYCIGIMSWHDGFFVPASYASGHNLHNYVWTYQVFEGFDRDVTVFANYHLSSNSGANLLLGSDNTEIGIYGGSMPFDPRMANPSVGRITVGGQTNQQGQLPVNIQIINQ